MVVDIPIRFFGNSEGGAATVPASVARRAGARGHGVPQSGQTQGWAGEVGLDEEVGRVLFVAIILDVAVVGAALPSAIWVLSAGVLSLMPEYGV